MLFEGDTIGDYDDDGGGGEGLEVGMSRETGRGQEWRGRREENVSNIRIKEAYQRKSPPAWEQRREEMRRREKSNGSWREWLLFERASLPISSHEKGRRRC